jgi:large subunit ribosomal protein L3
MPTRRMPHKGSMGYWPRKRSRRMYARVRTFSQDKEPKLLGFAGYKVGMTHLLINDNRKTSQTKGEDIFCPVSVIECPPIKIFSVRLYKKEDNKLVVKTEILSQKLNKDLKRKLVIPKKVEEDLSKVNISDFDDLKLVVYTQPRSTGIKKKPEIFELALGGSVEQKFNFAKEHMDKEIKLKDVFQDGNVVDVHSISKGKGTQGPVKRFGVSIRQAKSEKVIRGPGSLGPWCGQGHVMYRVAHAGKTGFYQRIEYNKRIIKISDKPEEINPKGGFVNFGNVKTTYVLLKGSVPGTKRRLIIMKKALRPNKKIPKEAPVVSYVSVISQQRR